MSIREINHSYQLAAARGHIPQSAVNPATLATILESGVLSFQRGYFGAKAWNEATSDYQANRTANEDAGVLHERLLTDISALDKPLRESMTTSDLAGVLGTIRSRILRQSLNPVESDIFALAKKRTAPDFRMLRATARTPSTA